MNALIDPGTLVRFLHVWSAATFAGLLFGLDWVLGPVLLADRTDPRVPRLAPIYLAALRWSGALAWGSGMTYALGWLARQDPQGAGRWFLHNQRGQWVTLAFGLASAAVFLAWFVAAPRWEQLARASGADAPHPFAGSWRRQAVVSTRLAAALGVPLLFAMGAARHLGESGGDLPTDMGDTALIVTGVGLALGLLLGQTAAAVTRRALAS